MNTAHWHPFEYELKYRLGEITIGQSRLHLLRKVYSLHDIRSFTSSPELPALPRSLEGYLLANIPQEGVTGAIRRQERFISYCLKAYLRCYIDMSGDFNGYQAKFSSKTRSGINRKVRKFAEHAGALDFRCYKTPDEVKEFFELARPVSADSYQERLLDCGLPTDPPFMEEAIAAAGRDEIRAFLLFSGSRAVSYLYCPIRENVLEYAFLGHVPDFAKLSPGTVLQWLALEQLFAEGRFTAFDFTEGESEHKRFFSTHQIPCSLELLLKPNLSTQLKARIHRGIDSASTVMGEGLDRMGLKIRIKKWLRHKAQTARPTR